VIYLFDDADIHVRLTKFFTARSTVTTLFATIILALLAASSIPQRASLNGQTPQWVGRLPGGLGSVVMQLGFDNIVGSSWFAFLAFLFLISLILSAVSQFSVARSFANRIPAAGSPHDSVRIDVDDAVFAECVETAGYMLAGAKDGVRRFVKNRIGYWGNFLLHVGLVTVVLFSIVHMLTQHKVKARLVGQEVTRLTPDSVQELRGVIPLQRSIPYTVVLNKLEPAFWENDQLMSLGSELYFTGKPGGDPERVAVALSDKAHFGSFLVYQSNAYGRAFDVILVSPGGERHRERLFLSYPPKRDAAGYGETAVAGTDYVLKGKFYADPGHTSMTFRESPLALRLYRGKEVLGEISLLPGATGRLGPFHASLAQTEWWTDILMDGTWGTSGIFAGFAFVLAGVLCSYCLVPREIIVRKGDGGVYVQHIARRFAPFYREEFDKILQSALDQSEARIRDAGMP
jgi:cytochrome c biogenesis protein